MNQLIFWLNNVFKNFNLLLEYDLIIDKMKELKKKKTAQNMIVGSGNFISQLFFAWVFWFIYCVRRKKHLKDLNLSLRKTETASFNDKILDKEWKKETELAAKENRFIIFE